MMQSSSGTVIMLPSVNPWAPILSPQSESAARTHRDTFTVGVELKLEPRSVPLPVINAFLAGAAATLLPKNYALLNIVYEYTYICYGSALLVSYFTYNFVWFWFCTIYTTLDLGIPGPPTLAAPLAALLALGWAHCRWLCLAAARFDLLYQAKATKWCGISNNNWENTKIQKEISVWGLQRVFGWQTWKKNKSKNRKQNPKME